MFNIQTFRALSSKTRVEILKKLKSRQMTLSELSDVLGMHVSAVSEHLAVLERAELVRRKDEGYKWKYYYLTKEGDGLFFAKGANIVLTLGIAAITTGALDIWSVYLEKTAALSSGVMEIRVLSDFYKSTAAANPMFYVGYIEGLAIIGIGIPLILYGLYGRRMKAR